MTANFAELKKWVAFGQRYEDLLSQLWLANEKYMQQSQKLNELESTFENESPKIFRSSVLHLFIYLFIYLFCSPSFVIANLK